MVINIIKENIFVTKSNFIDDSKIISEKQINPSDLSASPAWYLKDFIPLFWAKAPTVKNMDIDIKINMENIKRKNQQYWNIKAKTNNMLRSTILSKVISKSVPKGLVKFFFLAIAPSTESKYPDIQRKTTDKINLSK